MIAAIVRWLPLSLALHAAALAAAQLLPRDAALSPLFIDLTLDEPRTSPDRTTAPAPRRPAAAPGSRRTVSAPPPARRGPVSAPPAPPAPVPTPTPSATVAPPAPAAPDPVIPPAASPPALESHAPPSAPAPEAVTPLRTPTETGDGAPSAAASSGPGSSGGSAASTEGAVGHDAGTGSGSGTGGAGDTVALGISGDNGGVYAGYIALLRRRVQEALTYPSAARRRGMAGTVQVEISVEPTGRISEVVVVRSSSHEMLDSAALDAVRALRQIPFPPGVRPRAIRVRLPIVFELR